MCHTGFKIIFHCTEWENDEERNEWTLGNFCPVSLTYIG